MTDKRLQTTTTNNINNRQQQTTAVKQQIETKQQQTFGRAKSDSTRLLAHTPQNCVELEEEVGEREGDLRATGEY